MLFFCDGSKKMSLEIIMYHYVRPISGSAYPKIKGLEVKKFIKQIDYLQKNKKIVSTEDVIKAVKKKKIYQEALSS